MTQFPSVERALISCLKGREETGCARFFLRHQRAGRYFDAEEIDECRFTNIAAVTAKWNSKP